MPQPAITLTGHLVQDSPDIDGSFSDQRRRTPNAVASPLARVLPSHHIAETGAAETCLHSTSDDPWLVVTERIVLGRLEGQTFMVVGSLEPASKFVHPCKLSRSTNRAKCSTARAIIPKPHTFPAALAVRSVSGYLRGIHSVFAPGGFAHRPGAPNFGESREKRNSQMRLWRI